MRSPVTEEMNRKAKIKKTYNLLIQIAILILAYGFIYKEVFYKRNLPYILQVLWKDFSQPDFKSLILIVFALMFVNWAIESFKWKYLMKKIERIGFWKSFQAVFTGITISIFTPNRIGEYFGRVFILNTSSRIEGILVTVLGSMSQLIVTILTGSFALLAFIPLFMSHYWNFNGYIFYTMGAIVIGFNMLMLGFYLNVSFLSTWKERILRKGLKKIRNFLRIFAFYHTRELLKVLLLSFLRYMVFSFQFYLLLKIFAVPIQLVDAFIVTSLIYFVMAVIPTIALTELGIRGSVALYFFGIYFEQSTGMPETIRFGIFAATTILWIINLGIPALTGSIFVFHLKFFRKSLNHH